MYQLKRSQRIPATAEQVWEFISSPRSLAEITPEYFGFEITSTQLPEKIFAGMFITYNIRPLLGIKMKWVTEITQVRAPEYFVDEQHKGPYRVWRHQHLMRVIDGGTEMTDIVHYQPPLGFIGKLGHRLFLEKQLSDIFDYRFIKIEAHFGKFFQT